MTSSGLKFGSEEWKTHMRRSLAQRKRHGEKIDDIEGLITYIVKKGPAKGVNYIGSASRSRSGTRRKQSGSGSVEHSGNSNNSKKGRTKAQGRTAQKRSSSGTVKTVPVRQRGRQKIGRPQERRSQGQQEPPQPQRGVIVYKA